VFLLASHVKDEKTQRLPAISTKPSTQAVSNKFEMGDEFISKRKEF
jgi:hypothetical protein